MENFKDITEHQLEVGEVGVYKGNKYIVSAENNCCGCAFQNNDIKDCKEILCGVISFRVFGPILESIADTSNDDSDPTNICCEYFKTFMPLFSWFTINDNTLIMPNVNGIRVPYCPSCGKDIRNIQLSKKDTLQYFTNNESDSKF